MLVGSAGRLIYGGAVKWLPSQVAYLMFFFLGVVILEPMVFSTAPALALWPALMVSFVLAIGWNPGHGSYIDAGASPNPDNEDVRPITRAIAGAFSAKDGSVGYDCLGASVRYGLQTMLTGLAMIAANTWGGTHYSPWYMPVGLLAGVLLYGLSRVTTGQKLWRAFEAGIGALLYGALTLA